MGGDHAVASGTVVIREARPEEWPAVGELRVRAYVAGGFLEPGAGYEPRLRTLGTRSDGLILVAVDGAADPGAPRILGTIMLMTWPDTGQVVTGPEEAEIRALAVAPGTQGRGIGRALLRAAVEQAARAGARTLVLSTQPTMRTAHRLYESAGFGRSPDRDWVPEPGTELLVYSLTLPSLSPSASPSAGKGPASDQAAG